MILASIYMEVDGFFYILDVEGRVGIVANNSQICELGGWSTELMY